MANYELTIGQIRALGIAQKIANKETLDGLAEIAAYMDCSIGKVRLAIKHRGLPAAKQGNKIFTTKSLIQQWIRELHLKNVVVHGWDDPSRNKTMKRLLPKQGKIPLSNRYLEDLTIRFSLLKRPNPFLTPIGDDPAG